MHSRKRDGSSPEDSPFLIAAVSGRALAASAARAGHPVVVLDLFADSDTCAAAGAVRDVSQRRRLAFSVRRLLAAADELTPAGACAGVVPGSGFEMRPGLLAKLCTGRALHGNAPSVVRAVKHPQRFFRLLDDLGIRHPEVSFALPLRQSGWLVKRAGGAGGAHIRPARDAGAQVSRVDYFQRVVAGRSMSVLFVADGARFRIIGYNDLRHAGVCGADTPFLYGGALGAAVPGGRVTEQVGAALERLVAASGLVGLNGLDFIVDEHERVQVLEINPRPTATLDLYDADCDGGLFEWHLSACRGVLPRAAQRTGIARATAVVYAAQPLRVPDDLVWPEWTSDRPQPGLWIPQGAPVCTVRAEAGGRDTAYRLVQERERSLIQMLWRRAA
ncbi:MAG TPA: ATP-grasp domain-containing protein [Burkholderiales bacterium]|jgi:predicted ATP-grasp superfamily ATP-dependent carboligase|nr:ATP-grasp domain-containing protein [Burkholderiales bacterium]